MHGGGDGMTNISSLLPEERRLAALRLAEQLGNVAEACRRTGVDRSDFYEWRRRFLAGGQEGLRNRSRAHKSHPRETVAVLETKILELSLARPDWSCSRLAGQMAAEGTPLSSPTVQRLLVKHGLGSVASRMDRAERYAVVNPKYHAHDVRRILQGRNPCFGSGFRGAATPGELLVQGTPYIVRPWKFGRVYLSLVVDTYCSYAFLDISTSRDSYDATELLFDAVLPFYERQGFPVQAIATDDGKEFSGDAEHEYGAVLASLGITHRPADGRSSYDRGFIRRFTRTIREEIANAMVRAKRDIDWQNLRNGLLSWLDNYNHHRPNPGYPNFGATPISMVIAARGKRLGGGAHSQD